LGLSGLNFDFHLMDSTKKHARTKEAADVATAPRTKRNAVKPAQIAKAVDEGRESLDLYLDEISRVPLLSRDEEMELARKAFRGNVAAQEKLARHNVRFVVSVAKKFQNRGVPLVDLIGEGNLGLMTAARKFDPDRGVKFISYAVWWIRQAVQAAIARHGRPVRVPLNRTADLSRLGRTTTLLKEKLGRMPTTEELARATGLTPEAVRSLSALNSEAVRLDHPTRDGDGNERIERFAADQEGTDAGTMANSQTRTSRRRWPPCRPATPRCCGCTSASRTARAAPWRRSAG
jgi:RNA polymerase primary sigma factor